ncbi:lysine-rich nucleolar protein 1 isoform X2 [Aquila chrysaetos chrysaetos]|uniref:lysine-rich nucleolar protein 1 isoform X2 n=1 Tax=Aquila chrysaetos chrysaetos TaxID=223781 RepID=UPI00117716F5|nr:lysine-rich nucleolar protein 1 isoform X2 [Aquila chrysaetos chrysaetos]
MIIKRKEVHEEPIQKKKKVKSSRSQTIIKIEKDVQTVIKTEDDDQLESKTKVRKKENLKDDECLDHLELKKKKNKKKKVGSELLKEAHSDGFVNVEGHLDSEPQEESEEQIKVPKKKKKKFQCHSSLSLENNQSSDVELSNHHTDGTEENEFAFKKSRKITTLNSELDGEVTKKKKKKGIFSFSLEDIQDSEHKQSEKVHKKPHKYISQEKAFTGKNCGTDITQNDGESYVRRKKRKKKKEKSNSFFPLADNQDTYGVPDSPIALSDLRKRQRKNSQEITLTDREEEDSTENSRSIRETKRKKKRSKDISSLTCEDNQDYSHRVPDKHLSAQQKFESEEAELSGKKSRKNIKDNNEVTKKKKKKKIQKQEEETTYSKVSLNSDSASKSQKITLLESNKKNKESEMKQAECVRGDAIDGVLCNSNHMLCDRKRKKRKKEVPQDFTEEPGSKANTKKKKIKTEDMGNEALKHMDDVTIVQEKKGNCDEVNIDKDTKFGQWSTAAFQSSEEEMKFFRLMGGFKKGSTPIQNLSATKNKPNMALNREGEEKLQHALKMEFDKAMDLKQHRGIGLGFQPAANKKVYIDKYTSRSIKFED